MSEDKRTKIGATGPVATPAPAATEFMQPTGTPAPSATPPPQQHQTSYLPPAAPQADPLIGQVLAGRYHIQKKLGEGGMGAVYLAMHQLLEKQVALKVLHNEFARKPDLVERFIQEAKAASRIRHENVIDISDFGTTPEGIVFFAMELLNGHDLHEEIARARLAGQLLPYSRSKKIFLQICSALSAAHNRGIVHRDLKPENVYLVEFLGDPDFVKLLDFGIAKLTEVNEEGRKLTKTGMLFGTPEYMSPEQARGEHVDHRVDIYAMGCILFQLVTARVPFEADNFMGVLSMHLTQQPPEIPPVVFDRIGAPYALAEVIDRALHKDRDQRWQTIDELANAVRQVSGDPLVEPGRSTSALTAQRPASVPAPEHTTQARPATPTPAPLTPTTGDSRVRTQWTGNLQIPTEDAAPPPPKSKLPLIIGGIAIAAAAAVAVYFATRGGKGDDAPGGTTGPSGSQIAANPPPPPPVDAAVMPPPPPALPDYAEITIETEPKDAEVIDVGTKASRGTTPLTFKVAGSKEPRQFEIRLKGYRSTVIELVPNKEKLEPFKHKLVKGTGTTTVVVKPPDPGPGSAKPPGPGPGPGPGSSGSAVTVVKPPDPGPGSAKPPGPGSAKPPGDDCDDPPCIKTIVPDRLKKCTADADCPKGLNCTDGVCK